MTINLTDIILAVLTLIFGLLMRYIIPNVKSKTTAGQMELIRAAVKTAVYAVEQLYKSKTGKEKKQLVLDFLKEQGYIFDDKKVESEISYIIEEVVKELNIEQKEHVRITLTEAE